MGLLVRLPVAQFIGEKKYCKMVYIVRATVQGDRWAMSQGEMLSHKTATLLGGVSLEDIFGGDIML